MKTIIAAVSLLLSLIPGGLLTKEEEMDILTIMFWLWAWGAGLAGVGLGIWDMMMGGGWSSSAVPLLLATVPATVAGNRTDWYCDGDGDWDTVVLLCLSALMLTSNAFLPSPKMAAAGFICFGWAFLPWERIVGRIVKRLQG